MVTHPFLQVYLCDQDKSFKYVFIETSSFSSGESEKLNIHYKEFHV